MLLHLETPCTFLSSFLSIHLLLLLCSLLVARLTLGSRVPLFVVHANLEAHCLTILGELLSRCIISVLAGVRGFAEPETGNPFVFERRSRRPTVSLIEATFAVKRRRNCESWNYKLSADCRRLTAGCRRFFHEGDISRVAIEFRFLAARIWSTRCTVFQVLVHRESQRKKLIQRDRGTGKVARWFARWNRRLSDSIQADSIKFRSRQRNYPSTFLFAKLLLCTRLRGYFVCNLFIILYLTVNIASLQRTVNALDTILVYFYFQRTRKPCKHDCGSLHDRSVTIARKRRKEQQPISPCPFCFDKWISEVRYFYLLHLVELVQRQFE